MTIERRSLAGPIEFREAENSGGVIRGYAAVFNSETAVGSCFRERVSPGCFAKAVSADVRALFNHQTGAVLGRTKAGTLRLQEDSRGLAVEIDLPNTQLARDLTASMNRGDIDGMSFGFRAIREEWDETGDVPLRTLLEVELLEVSVVTFPQYDEAAAEIALRSLDASREERRQRAEHNRSAAEARIAARRAESEQKFRRIG